MDYVNSREVMRILSIKSMSTILKYESIGKLKPIRILGSNRKRYNVKDLEKILKGY